jgi:hypothetical protein
VSVTASAVPEPGTAALLAGAILLFVRAKARRSVAG